MVVILQHGATLTLRFHAEIKQTVGALTESVSSGGCSLFFIAATSTPLAALDKLGNSLPHLNTHMQKNTLSQIISTCQNSFFCLLLISESLPGKESTGNFIVCLSLD